MSATVRPGVGDRDERGFDREVELVAAEPPPDRRLPDPGDHGALFGGAHRRDRPEERDEHGCVVLEDHLDRHADAHVVGVDVDDVRRQADVGLLVDRDEADDVDVADAVPRLVVHGERVDGAAAAHLGRRGVAARGSCGQIGAGGWMRYEHAAQRRKRSLPSAPDVQKNALGSSRVGSTRNRIGHLSSAKCARQ